LVFFAPSFFQAKLLLEPQAALQGGEAVEALNDELVAQRLDFTRQVRDLLHEKAALLETLASTQQSLKELAVAHSAAVRVRHW
jgi:uncharacterized coiled-coil protein SlyX